MTKVIDQIINLATIMTKRTCQIYAKIIKKNKKKNSKNYSNSNNFEEERKFDDKEKKINNNILKMVNPLDVKLELVYVVDI